MSVRYSIAAASGSGTPAGNVTVSDGIASCTGTVAAGSCDLVMSTNGARMLTASYAGDANFNSSVSAPEPHTVTAIPTDGGGGPFSGGPSTGVPQTVTPSRKPLAHISAASETHRSFRAASKPRLAQVSRGSPPVGTTFAYKLDHPALVRFDFTQATSGRMVNGKCIARTKRNERNRACTPLAGSLSFAGHSGLNSIRFTCWLSQTKRLRPGKYTLVLTAVTADVGSTSQRLKFAIVP